MGVPSPDSSWMLLCLSCSPAGSSMPVLSWLWVFTSWSPGLWCCTRSSCGASGSSRPSTATGNTGSSTGILGHTSSRRPPWEASMSTPWSWTVRSSVRLVSASDGWEGALGADFGWEKLPAGTQGWICSGVRRGRWWQKESGAPQRDPAGNVGGEGLSGRE